MASVVRLVQGDDLPGVSLTIRDSNKAAAGQELDRRDTSTWAPVDLRNSSLFAVISRIGENRQIDTVFIAPQDPQNGVVILHLDDCTFLYEVGLYECEVTVRFDAGQQTVYDRVQFDVKERINASSAN
jgi:hypothetical protein